MDKTKFTLYYEEVLNDLNMLNNEKQEKNYKSFEEFRHFIKQFNLLAELNSDYKKTDKYIECSLYFMNETDSENKSMRFDYFNKNNKEYYKKYKDIFDVLTDYNAKFIVTLDGEPISQKIIWG